MEGLTFADKFLSVVTSGDHNSTYKMATAIALLQVAQETPAGTAVSTKRIAEVVIDLYWLQVRVSDGSPPLRQMNRSDQGSRILDAINSLAVAEGTHRPQSPSGAPGYPDVVDEVEDALLSYPLRLLQSPDDQFLFSVPFPLKETRTAFGKGFTGSLQVHEGVAPLLQRAAPLLRPLIEAAWLRKVARYNGITLDESHLTRRLFGYERTAWPPQLRAKLELLQHGCFYCGRPLPKRTAGDREPGERQARSATHIDHFVPWSRTMNDAIENLVLADDKCNLRKSDYLCSPELVHRWADRLEGSNAYLRDTAERLHWPTALLRTVRTAFVQYDRYPRFEVIPVWNGMGVEPVELRTAANELERLLSDLAC